MKENIRQYKVHWFAKILQICFYDNTNVMADDSQRQQYKAEAPNQHIWIYVSDAWFVQLQAYTKLANDDQKISTDWLADQPTNHCTNETIYFFLLTIMIEALPKDAP